MKHLFFYRFALVVCIFEGSLLSSLKAAEPDLVDPLRPVHSTGGHFTVQLPGTCTQVPDKPSHNPNILHTYALTSRLPSTDTLFVAVKFVYHDAAAARVGYELALKPPAGFALVSHTSVQQSGLSGQDTKTRSPKGNGYAYTRVLLGGDAVFLLVAESLPGRDAPVRRRLHAFFDSLIPGRNGR